MPLSTQSLLFLIEIQFAEEEMEAGNYTTFTAYTSGVMKVVNTTTYLDCYEQCQAFSGEILLVLFDLVTMNLESHTPDSSVLR
jgi:hypothetical protein